MFNDVQPAASRPRMQGYGLQDDAGASFLAWGDTVRKIEQARNYWICSTRPDGRPHAMPVWAVWHDGALYFGTGDQSQKARNLAIQPAVVVHLESGDDCVIVEGVAVEAASPGMDALDAAYEAKYGLTLSQGLEGGGILFAVRPRKAFAWLETDFVNSATRWQWPAEGD